MSCFISCLCSDLKTDFCKPNIFLEVTEGYSCFCYILFCSKTHVL